MTAAADGQVSRLSIVIEQQHQALGQFEDDALAQTVFEIELAHVLLDGHTYIKKSRALPSEVGSDYETRLVLVGKLIALSCPSPPEQKRSIIEFIAEARRLVAKLPATSSSSSSASSRRDLDRLVFHLEAELRIFSALKFYLGDDNGESFTEDTDPDDALALERFRHEVHTMCIQLRRPIDPMAAGEEADAVERNLVLDRVQALFGQGGRTFSRDGMEALYAEFAQGGTGRVDVLMRACKLLVVELQRLLLPCPIQEMNKRFGSKAASVPAAATPPAAAATGSKRKRAAAAEKKKQEEEEEKPPQPPPPQQQQEDYVPPEGAPDVEEEKPVPPSAAAATTSVVEEEQKKTKKAKVAVVEEEQPAAEKKPQVVEEVEAVKSSKKTKKKQKKDKAEEPAAAAAAAATTTTTTSEEDEEEEKKKEQKEADEMFAPPPPPPPPPVATVAPQKARAPFADEEKQALRDGVAKHGKGNWKAILIDPDFAPVFASVKPRTAINLKDLWRTIS